MSRCGAANWSSRVTLKNSVPECRDDIARAVPPSRGHTALDRVAVDLAQDRRFVGLGAIGEAAGDGNRS